MPHPKVLFVVASNARRGAETQASQVVNELVGVGLDASVVALAPGRNDDAPLDVTCLGARQLGPSTLWRLRHTAKSFDLVVAFGSTTLPAAALALAFSGRPWVYRNIGDPTAWQRGALHRERTGLLMRRASGVIALWSGAAETIESDYRVPRRRIRVVPNSRSSAQFTAAQGDARAQARAEFGLPIEAEVIAFVGALSPEKNPELAIESVARLAEVHLVIAGDGPLRSTCEQLAERRAPGRVHFLGSIPDVQRLYHAADAVLLTSRTEGMPGVLIEAALSELPVAATNVGAVADMVVPGVTGVVTNEDPEGIALGIRQALGIDDSGRRAARARCVETFDRSTVIQLWVEALKWAVSLRR